MTSPRDRNEPELYDADEEELEELNRSTSTSTFMERRWWRWAIIAVAVLVIVSFTVPAVLPLLGLGDDNAVEPGAGVPVPNFTLDSPNRGTVRLSDQVAANDHVVLVFYRTYH